MKHSPLVTRALLLAIVLGGAVLCWSCSTPGIGVGMEYPARWGGSSGPPVFAGGPSY